MITQNAHQNSRTGQDSTFSISAVYCKLFSDSISAPVCLIRKQELDKRGDFDCTGCSMEKL